ncbi:hypothetical protein CO641_07655 [Lysobacteraceae bacterium NML91-0213]|nr:hypothetical protein CO641_07655 [Xanthomonadaceae bacterium NML91-0213]
MLERAAAVVPAPLRAQLPPLRLHPADTLPVHVHGRQRGHDIQLPRELVLAPVGDDGADPALAALLHEIGHVLDARLGLSRDPRLLDLAGWQLRPRRFGLRDADNRLRDRSPDPYELHSPKEFVAVNLEHFLLDPRYRCRRPALHRHFAARLGVDGAGPPAAPCPEALPFVTTGGLGTTPPLHALEPARVYAVEYLFAEPTRAPMSRWGHGMLRLVVCAPGRAPGPDCRFDLDHHRVLSFRAFVDDVQISSWRGLTGHYPSRLFVLPLSQVVDEYTHVELRGLRSVPLRLQPAEIAAVVERAAQLHWTYDGRYTFLGNNCATETFKLLHDAVPRLASERLAAITPNGLLRKLERRGIADASLLDDAGAAVRLGYHFPAADAHYRDLFEVADSALGLPVGDADGWLDLAADARSPWLDQGDLRATAALLVLEEAALRRTEGRARDVLKRRLARPDADATGSRGLLEQVLVAEGLLVRPAALLAGVPGYGLPQAEELQAAGDRAAALDTTRLDQADRLRQEAEAILPRGMQLELETTRANIARAASRLRALSASTD